MKPSDRAIIKDCQKGNLERFGELYDRYFDKIYRFVFYKTSHRETAEDLTSETFRKALDNINNFQTNKGTFQAWLFCIARNTVIDYYRTKKEISDIDNVAGLSQEENLNKEIDNKDKLSKVNQYLGQLDGLQREVLVLRVWQEMPYKEIAQVVGKTEGACKMIFLRTVKKMKSELLPLHQKFLL